MASSGYAFSLTFCFVSCTSSLWSASFAVALWSRMGAHCDVAGGRENNNRPNDRQQRRRRVEEHELVDRGEHDLQHGHAVTGQRVLPDSWGPQPHVLVHKSPSCRAPPSRAASPPSTGTARAVRTKIRSDGGTAHLRGEAENANEQEHRKPLPLRRQHHGDAQREHPGRWVSTSRSYRWPTDRGRTRWW